MVKNRVVIVAGVSSHLIHRLINRLICDKNNTIMFISFDIELLDMQITMERLNQLIGSKSIDEKRLHIVKGTSSKPNFGLDTVFLQKLQQYEVTSLWYIGDNSPKSPLKNELSCEVKIARHRSLRDFIRRFQIAHLFYISDAAHEIAFNVTKCKFEHKCRILNNVPQSIKDSFCNDLNCLVKDKTRTYHTTIYSHPSLIISQFDQKEAPKFLLYDLMNRLFWFKNYVNDRHKNYYKTHFLGIERQGEGTIDLIPIDTFVDEIVNHASIRDRHEDIAIFFKSKTISMEKVFVYLSLADFEIETRLISDLSELTPLDHFFAAKAANTLNALKHSLPYENVYKINSDWFEENSFIDHLVSYKKHLQQMEETKYEKTEESIKRLKRHQMKCRFQKELTYYTLGEGPPILLLTPIVSSFRIWQEILHFLARNYRVITWESRGLEDTRYYSKDEDFCFDQNERVQDIIEVMTHENLKRAHIVGWCASSADVLMFYKNHPERVSSLTLISGRYSTSVSFWTDYDAKMKVMAQAIINEHGVAGLFIRSLTDPHISKDTKNNMTHQFMTEIINRPHSRYNAFLREKLLLEENFIRYCERTLNYKYIDIENIIDNVTVPCLIITGDNDVIAYPCQAEWLADRINNSILVCFPATTHWIILENGDAVATQIDNFISKRCSE